MTSISRKLKMPGTLEARIPDIFAANTHNLTLFCKENDIGMGVMQFSNSRLTNMQNRIVSEFFSETPLLEPKNPQNRLIKSQIRDTI